MNCERCKNKRSIDVIDQSGNEFSVPCPDCKNRDTIENAGNRLFDRLDEVLDAFGIGPAEEEEEEED